MTRGWVLSPDLEIFAEEGRKRVLRWEDGRLDELSLLETAGVGLRRLDRDVRFAHLECRHPLSRGLTTEEAAHLGRLAGSLSRARARPAAFPSPVPTASREARLDPLVRWLRAAESAARLDRRVRQATFTLGESERRVAVRAPGSGPVAEKRRQVVFMAQVTVSAGGLIQTGTEVVAGAGGWKDLAGFEPAKIARRAARRALKKLEAPPAKAGESAVVVSAEAGGTLIHEAVGHSLEADHVQDGSSPHYAGKIGRVVAGERVTVIDDPTRPRQRGSFGFDDEGTEARPTVLIENGVLKTYLYDRRTALRDGRPSNGHGRRESYAHPPVPRMSNTYVAPGTDDPAGILRELRRGLYVTRLGGGQVNTTNGDFVFEVEEGWWVEDGRIRHMVRGANLLGNGPEVLRSIDRVGTDLGWAVGTCGKEGQGVPVSDGLPTLRIPRVVVGGA